MRTSSLSCDLLQLVLLYSASTVLSQPVKVLANTRYGNTVVETQTWSGQIPSSSVDTQTKLKAPEQRAALSNLGDDLHSPDDGSSDMGTRISKVIDMVAQQVPNTTLAAQPSNAKTMSSAVATGEVASAAAISTAHHSMLRFLPFLSSFWSIEPVNTFPFIPDTQLPSPTTPRAPQGVPAMSSATTIASLQNPNQMASNASVLDNAVNIQQSATLEETSTNFANASNPVATSLATPTIVSSSAMLGKTIDNTAASAMIEAITAALSGATTLNSGKSGFAVVPITAGGVKGIAILPVSNGTSSLRNLAPVDATKTADAVAMPVAQNTTASIITSTSTTFNKTESSPKPVVPAAVPVPLAAIAAASNSTLQTTNAPVVANPATTMSPNNFNNGAQHTINKTPQGSGYLAPGIASSLQASAINPTGIRVDGALSNSEMTLLVPTTGTIRVVTSI